MLTTNRALRARVPSLRFLRTFLAVTERGSFKAAAAHLSLTASAVSHQIKELESQLGVSLFERGGKSMRVTEAARDYRNRIAPLIAQLDAATLQLSGRFGRALVRLSAPPFFCSELLVPRLSDFSAANPDVDLQIAIRLVGNDGHSSDADLAIAVGCGPWPRYSSAVLFPLTFVPVCAPSLLNSSLMSSNAAQTEHLLPTVPLIVDSNRPRLWDQWAEANQVDEIGKRQRIHFDSMAAVVDAAVNGMGMALVSESIAATRLGAGSLRRIGHSQLATNDGYYVLGHLHQGEQPSVQALQRWLIREFRSGEVSTEVRKTQAE